MRHQGNGPSRKRTRAMLADDSPHRRSTRTIKRIRNDRALADQLADAALITYASALTRGGKYADTGGNAPADY